MKVCTKCGAEKTLDGFGRDRGRLRSHCKVCATAAGKKWGEENRERVARNRKKWREENPGRYAANSKKWREENQARVAANNKKWYEENRERVAAYNKKRREENPERERELQLKRKYGIGLVEYQQMADAQNGKCAICRGENEHRSMPVDHDHHTGQVRGLLCDLCNQMIGLGRDNEFILESAIEYLRKHRAIGRTENLDLI
jgi:hypothetical protein